MTNTSTNIYLYWYWSIYLWLNTNCWHQSDLSKLQRHWHIILSYAVEWYSIEIWQSQNWYLGYTTVRLWYVSWYHWAFLLHCCNYDNERQEMMNYIKDTGCGQNTKDSLCVSGSLLLAPPSADDGVSKKVNMFIKEALFEFLAKTKRSI